jgi:peptide/nickel transport system substrate-binding protein
MTQRALVLLLLLLALAGCGARGRDPTTTFSFTEGEDIDSLNPILTTEVLGNDLSMLTQGYLVTFDQRNRLVPSLCLRVPTQTNHLISQDGRTITYELRRGVRWHDGHPFTAADIAFSVRTILNPHVNTASTLGYDQISRLDTPNDHTVVVHLKRPYAPFVSIFMTPAIGSGILPKHILQGQDVNRAAYNSLPVGLGPFQYVSWSRGSSIQLKAFDGWWGGRPKLRRIEYKIIPDASTAITQLRTRELSAFGRVPNDQYVGASTISQTRTLNYDSTAYEHIDFNNESPLVRDVRVRQALAHAIDVRTIVQKADHGAGVLACTPIPVSSWAYYSETSCYDYNLTTAGNLLDAAGWRMRSDGIRYKDGVPLRLTLVSTVGNLSRDETAIIIQAAFHRIGVPLQYIHYQANQLFANVNGILASGKYDLGMYAWYWGADPDISTLYACSQRPPHGQNYSRYCNPQVDALLSDALVTYDRAKRRADYVRIQKLIAQDVPSVVLFQWVDHLTADTRFSNLAPGPILLFTKPAAISGAF